MSEVGAEGHPVSAGTLLREAREAAGLHAETLAATLKVPVRKLEALEQDRYDLLPDAVFVRALASSVCRTLKIDPQPVLERLPQQGQPRLMQASDGINTPFRGSGDPKPGRLEHVSRPVLLIVAALLVAAAVLVFLPKHEDNGPVARNGNDAVMPPGTPAVISPPAETVPESAAPLTPSTSLARTPAAPAVATSAASPATSPATPAAPVAAAAATAAPVAPPAAAASAAAAAPTDAASAAMRPVGIVTFRTKGTSWVQVTDANGTQVLRKLMAPGETAGASGALPLAVTVGSVEQTEVLVRGKPFNLGPVSRDNVARFEVK